MKEQKNYLKACQPFQIFRVYNMIQVIFIFLIYLHFKILKVAVLPNLFLLKGEMGTFSSRELVPDMEG